MQHKQSSSKFKQKGYLINPFSGSGLNPYGANTVLQLDGRGQDFLSPIVDSSPYNRAVTSYGRGYITKKKYVTGKSSIFLGGVEPISFASSNDFNFNIPKWTLETYFNIAGMNTGDSLCSRRSNAQSAYTEGVGFALSSFRAKINNVWSNSQLSWTFPSSMVWHHYRVVKDGTTIYVFIDGNIVATKTGVNTIYDAPVSFNIGSGMDTVETSARMFIQHFRIIKNEALSTVNFVPTPYLTVDNTVYDSDFDSQGRDKLLKLAHLQILGDGATIEDSSPSGCTITTSGTTPPSISTTRSKWGTKSIYLPLGSSLNISSPANKYCFRFIGDYEISLQVYFEGLPTANSVFLYIASSEADGRIGVTRSTTGGFFMNRYGSADTETTAAFPINQWGHLVFGRINSYYYISYSGRIHWFNKSDPNPDGNLPGKLIINTGGSNTYINSVRVLPFRNDFDSINPADFDPPTQEFSKIPIPDGYDPLFQRVIFLCPFDSLVSQIDKSKRNLVVELPETSQISNVAESLNGELTKTVASGPNFVAIHLARNLSYENWTLELGVTYSNFGTIDCRIAVIGYDGINYPLYLQIGQDKIPYVSALSNSWISMGSALVENTRYRFIIVKQGRLFHMYNQGVFRGTASSTLIVSKGVHIFTGGSNASGSVWTIDDARLTLGTRYGVITDSHSAAFPTQ